MYPWKEPEYQIEDTVENRQKGIVELAKAYGIQAGEIVSDDEIHDKLSDMLNSKGPYLMVCRIDPDARTGD